MSLLALSGQPDRAKFVRFWSNNGQQSVWAILVNAIPVLKGAGKKPKTPAIAMSCICIWCGQEKWDR
jgi:hypothetical protein